MRAAHLDGPDAATAWLAKLKLELKFRYQNSRRLFDRRDLVRILPEPTPMTTSAAQFL